MSKDVLFRLEPYDGKLSRTVLRGASSLVTDLWAGNGPRLLDPTLGNDEQNNLIVASQHR